MYVIPASRLQVAQKGIESLRERFLPQPFDLLGTYPDQVEVQALARAFVVFAHAEVEGYLEESARAIAKASEAVWAKHGRITPPAMCLFACIGSHLKVPTAPTGPDTVDIGAQLSKALGQLA